MNQLEAFLAFFAGQSPFEGLGLPALSVTYDWPRGREETWPELPTGVFGDLDNAHSKYRYNVSLKLQLRKILSECVERRMEIANWIIRDWGGIKSNKRDTISHYVSMLSTDCSHFPIKGIASYSKLLSFYDFDRYAIYDSRVAVSLNAIQFIASADRGLAFPYLSGRNNITGNSIKKVGFSHLKKFSTNTLCLDKNWIRVSPNSAYSEYINFLSRIQSDLNNAPLYSLEMALFAQAETLAIIAEPTFAHLK